jgi:uncharacterized membrane protein YbjE (DUF340 family)
MKDSTITVLFFVIGITLGYIHKVPSFLLNKNWSLYVLYALLFFIGIAIGGNEDTWHMLKKLNIKILLVPFSIGIGSIAGAGIISLVIKSISLREAMAVGAGFGYYSLSSIIITQLHSQVLGTIALVANLSREIITLLFTPLLVRYFGKLSPIASGGATSMDVTLPVITKFTSERYALISVVSGVVLTILVPIVVTFILTV